jgi:hypothetical protein
VRPLGRYAGPLSEQWGACSWLGLFMCCFLHHMACCSSMWFVALKLRWAGIECCCDYW